MKLSWFKTDSAWQPFTFRGVAAFADASLKRLLVGQVVVALASAWTVVWFLGHSWFPVIESALQVLPVSGELRNGELVVEPQTPMLLGENRFLAFIVDPRHSGTVRVPAHVQAEFGTRTIRVISLFGTRDWPYPDKSQPVDRLTLEPRWGAWRTPLLWTVFGGVAIGLVLVWWALSSIYMLPIWLLALFSNRKLSLTGSWRLAGAALLPGALLMLMGIISYGMGLISLVDLLAVQAVHWVCGVVYCIGSVRARPWVELGEAAKNPFETATGKESKSPKPPENPFQSGPG